MNEGTGVGDVRPYSSVLVCYVKYPALVVALVDFRQDGG